MSNSISGSDVTSVVLACEAGMGSSLMVVSQIKKKLKKAKIKGIKVSHAPARSLTPDTKLVVVHKRLAGVVKANCPDTVIVPFDMFMNDPVFDKLVDAIANDGEIVGM